MLWWNKFISISFFVLFLAFICRPEDLHRIRVEHMERQLANLTGLVQKALTQTVPVGPQIPQNMNQNYLAASNQYRGGMYNWLELICSHISIRIIPQQWITPPHKIIKFVVTSWMVESVLHYSFTHPFIHCRRKDLYLWIENLLRVPSEKHHTILVSLEMYYSELSFCSDVIGY